MPPNYQQGKIYSIRSHQTDQIYIGSTTQSLCRRFVKHKQPTNKSNSKEILKYEDAYIELIELFPCNSKEELNRKEGEHIRASNNCVNKRIAGRTNKEYYDTNHDKIAEQQKEYYQNNHDKILERNKEHYEANRNKILEQKKEYYQANKDKITEQQKQYYLRKKQSS